MTNYRVILVSNNNRRCVLSVTDKTEESRVAFRAAVRKATELQRKYGYGSVELEVSNAESR